MMNNPQVELEEVSLNLHLMIGNGQNQFQVLSYSPPNLVGGQLQIRPASIVGMTHENSNEKDCDEMHSQ